MLIGLLLFLSVPLALSYAHQTETYEEECERRGIKTKKEKDEESRSWAVNWAHENNEKFFVWQNSEFVRVLEHVDHGVVAYLWLYPDMGENRAYVFLMDDSVKFYTIEIGCRKVLVRKTFDELLEMKQKEGHALVIR